MPKLLTNHARWIGLIALAGVLGALVWSRCCLSREPVYQGRSLTEWLGDLVEPDGPMDREKMGKARKAILALDTNAIPGLVALMSRHDSAARKWAQGVMSKQSIVRVRLLRAEGAHELAFLGFEVLGPRAEPAIPALERLALQTDDPCAGAARALMLIGPPSALALGRTLTTADPTVRERTALAIIHGKFYHAHAWRQAARSQLPEDLLVALRQLTTSTNAWEFVQAAEFLLSTPEMRGAEVPNASHAPNR